METEGAVQATKGAKATGCVVLWLDAAIAINKVDNGCGCEDSRQGCENITESIV